MSKQKDTCLGSIFKFIVTALKFQNVPLKKQSSNILENKQLTRVTNV